MINSNKYTNNIKNKLLKLLEQILKINNFNHQIEIKIPLEKNINDFNEINQKLYLLSLLNENNIDNLEKKILDIITNMLLYLNQNNFEYFFYYNDIIIKYINNNNLIKFNLIDNDIISKLNNVYIHSSPKIIEHENNNEICNSKGLKYYDIKIKLINDLYKTIYELNVNNFKNKINNNKIDGKKNIFSGNSFFILN